jgi:hypothetical protein
MSESPPVKRRYSMFPKTLSACVEPLTRPVLKAQGLAGSRILTDWHTIVGPHLAKFTIPEKIAFPPGKKNGGTLTIAAENGFATELQHMQAVILERLAGYFGYTAITRVVISHSYLPAAKPPAIKPRIAKSLPATCAAAAESVTDPELRAALQSLAKTLSGQNS